MLTRVIASQPPGITLPLRRLLISPCGLDANIQGRGGKAVRERVGATRRYFYSGSVFGCILGAAVHFARKSDDRISDLMRTMLSCLQPAGKDAMSCTGDDAGHLQRGFASHHVIRSQLAHLDESKTYRIDSKYGRKSVVLSISVVMYFVLNVLKDRSDNSSSVSFAAAHWLHTSHEMLRNWRWIQLTYCGV